MRSAWTRLPLACWRLAGLLLHLLHGVAVAALRFQSLDARGRQRYVQWWSARLLRVIGVRLDLRGRPRAGATLFIANHVSWLDIASLHGVCPQARFVAKADVLRWPLLGHMIRQAGTLFIERERKRDALRVVHQMAEALRLGDSIAVFPEGTTGPGPQLLPFHANLLQAAIAVEAPIQPIVLRYSEPGRSFGESAQYIGDTTLLASIWRIVNASGLTVHVHFLPAVGSAHADRRSLAQHLRGQVQDRLNQVARTC